MLTVMATSNVAAKSRNGRKHSYTVYFEPQLDGSYHVVFPGIPEIVTFGRSLEDARRMAADALKCHLEGLAKDGVALPAEKVPRGKLRQEELVVIL
jgi:predicted RNase H-like HicB family nuclease